MDSGGAYARSRASHGRWPQLPRRPVSSFCSNALASLAFEGGLETQDGQAPDDPGWLLFAESVLVSHLLNGYVVYTLDPGHTVPTVITARGLQCMQAGGSFTRRYTLVIPEDSEETMPNMVAMVTAPVSDDGVVTAPGVLAAPAELLLKTVQDFLRQKDIDDKTAPVVTATPSLDDGRDVNLVSVSSAAAKDDWIGSQMAAFVATAQNDTRITRQATAALPPGVTAVQRPLTGHAAAMESVHQTQAEIARLFGVPAAMLTGLSSGTKQGQHGYSELETRLLAGTVESARRWVDFFLWEYSGQWSLPCVYRVRRPPPKLHDIVELYNAGIITDEYAHDMAIPTALLNPHRDTPAVKDARTYDARMGWEELETVAKDVRMLRREQGVLPEAVAVRRRDRRDFALADGFDGSGEGRRKHRRIRGAPESPAEGEPEHEEEEEGDADENPFSSIDDTDRYGGTGEAGEEGRPTDRGFNV